MAGYIGYVIATDGNQRTVLIMMLIEDCKNPWLIQERYLRKWSLPAQRISVWFVAMHTISTSFQLVPTSRMELLVSSSP
jgi:hypothetical protein